MQPERGSESDLLRRWGQDFGANIQRAREAKQLTRKELAERVGLNAATIANYERGLSSLAMPINPTLTTFVALCQALDVKPPDLLPSYPLPLD